MLFPLMNNTKWNELRLAMDGLHPTPEWSTLCINGYRSTPDREWYYHFSVGGYEDIIHVDVFADSPSQRDGIRTQLQQIHLPGEETCEGFRIYGYAQVGQTIDYL